MPNKRSSTPKLPVLDGKGGLLPGIDPSSNASMLDAVDDLSETRYLLIEPANAAHLLRSIKQHRKGKTKVVRKLRSLIASGTAAKLGGHYARCRKWKSAWTQGTH